MTPLVRLYRLALLALPPALRRKHGTAMEALFTDELARARAGGRRRLLRLACPAVLDALRRGLYERSRLFGRGGWAVRGDAHGREPGWGRGMDSLRQDLTFAVRSFARAPRFTAAVVVTLALGIGASSAVFSVLDAVVLRPLPFPDAGRFVHLAWDHGRGPTDALTPIQFEYWRENTSSFEAVATYRSFLARVDDGDQVAGIPAMRVSADFLRAVGWSPVIGRGFTEEEDRAGGPAVVMVSHGLWERRFGGAPDVVGRSLRIGERPHVVVGVLPPDFSFPQVSRTPEVLVPLAMRVDPSDEGENWSAIARLRPDVSHEAAAADVGRLVAPFAVAYPNQVYGDGPGMSVTSFRTVHVGGGLTTALSVAMGAVGLVLLIACANVANLLLARATQRRREIALRAALGATRSRIVRVAVTEGVVLALASGALGLLVARWGVGAILSLSPVRLPRMGEIGLDWRVLGFAASAALVTGVVFGGVAALPALRARLAGTLKEGARGASASARGRQGLLVAQAALAMVLLVVSGLFIASLAKLARVDKGFDPEGVVAVRLPFSPPGYADTEARWELQRRFLEEAREALPGVGAASASNLPLERGLNIPVSIGGRLDDFEGAVQWRSVSPGYFETLGIPLVAGRDFGPGDEAGGPPVAIVNQAFFRRWFPGADPIGQRVEIGRYRGDFTHPSLEGPGAEIVGVVADVREVSLRADASRTVYVPAAQAPSVLDTWNGGMPVFMLRPPSRGTVSGTNVREWLRAADPGLPDPEVLPLGDVVSASLAQERFGAWLLSTFATLALLLTAFGIHGVLAYTVRQRRREIGIRIALGAGGVAVARLVGRQGMAPVAVGLVLGTGAAVWLSRPVAGMLWDVGPSDPVTIGSVALLLLGVAFVASLLPAREALRVDPVRTLNEE